MIKRSAVMGIGFVLLVIGLAGLTLLQKTVVYGPESKVQRGLLDIKPQVPSQEGSGRQTDLERRQLPELSDSIKHTPETASLTGQVPTPLSGEGPLKPGAGSDTGGASGAINPRHISNGVGEQQSTSGDQAPERAISIQQAGKDERSSPEQGQAELQVTAKPGAETTQDSLPSGSKARSHRSPDALQPVAIRFHFDPALKREIDVAVVHFGDSVSVRVRRSGQADLGLHLAFVVPDTLETDTWRGWSTGPRRAVVAPIQYIDRIDLSAARGFGVALTRKLDSKEGAVLKLGADYSRGQNLEAPRGGPARAGGCEIEMKIYPGNHWNIKPRGLV